MSTTRWTQRVSAADWPVAAGALLAVIAVVDLALREPGPGADMLIALVLALASTLALSLARANLWLATVVSAAALGMTLLSPRQRPTVAAIAAIVLLLGLIGYRLVEKQRRGAAQREETQRVASRTMLAHAAASERARIARDLHDVVAHHISLISVQAETARLTVAGMPPEGAERLRAISYTARTALTEMRRLLGVLREDADAQAPREPQPGLRDLVALVDEARQAAGIGTRLIVHGPVVDLDPGTELTAFRVVQEALTNARRHAPGAAVDVELDYHGKELHVRVRDDGPGPASDTASDAATGNGLLGMRERVAAVGGELRTGPAPLTGFLVEARLPVGNVA